MQLCMAGCRFSKVLSLLYLTIGLVWLGGLGIFAVTGESLYDAFWQARPPLASSAALHAHHFPLEFPLGRPPHLMLLPGKTHGNKEIKCPEDAGKY